MSGAQFFSLLTSNHLPSLVAVVLLTTRRSILIFLLTLTLVHTNIAEKRHFGVWQQLAIAEDDSARKTSWCVDILLKRKNSGDKTLWCVAKERIVLKKNPFRTTPHSAFHLKGAS